MSISFFENSDRDSDVLTIIFSQSVKTSKRRSDVRQKQHETPYGSENTCGRFLASDSIVISRPAIVHRNTAFNINKYDW